MPTNIRYSLINGKNGRHWEYLVNYALPQLMEHLENRFKPGMSWDNYGEWHIDHKIPISWWQFKNFDDKEFKQC